MTWKRSTTVRFGVFILRCMCMRDEGVTVNGSTQMVCLVNILVSRVSVLIVVPCRRSTRWNGISYRTSSSSSSAYVLHRVIISKTIAVCFRESLYITSRGGEAASIVDERIRTWLHNQVDCCIDSNDPGRGHYCRL